MGPTKFDLRDMEMEQYERAYGGFPNEGVASVSVRQVAFCDTTGICDRDPEYMSCDRNPVTTGFGDKSWDSTFPLPNQKETVIFLQKNIRISG